jgi:hypothetical protein
MRKPILASITALTLAGAVVAPALAQPAPPPPAGGPGPAEAGPEVGHPPRGLMGRGPMWEHWRAMQRERPFAPGTFSLFDRRADKHLSAADVQQIAQALLLWNGNHEWKVVDVQEAPNHEVSFAYATVGGSVIARFQMNRDTGRITRVG